MLGIVDDHPDISVGDATLQHIRTDIIFGRLAPGQKLTLDRIKDQYGVAVSTLREILNRLVPEDLVVAEGNKGFRVAPVSEHELREVADLRLLLESHALTKSFANGDLDWEGRIVAAHHKLAAIEKQQIADEAVDQEQWKRFDYEFHQALVSACGSEPLLRAHAAAFNAYLRYQMLAMSFRGAGAAREHERLQEAALARDIDAAQRLLRAHIGGGVDVALSSKHFS